jgi:DNA invertase Pin-like site-specific DNA recombinase
MAEGKFIAYYRVSTDKQGKSGLGLEAQRDAVTQYLNGGSWSLLADYTEVESGKRDDRPQLLRAMAHCRLSGAKLIIAKLDRLSRDAAFLLTLQKGDVAFVAADMPHADNFTVGVLALVAQREREMISQRTKAALAAAKRRGVKLSGFRGHVGDPTVARDALVAKADEFADRVRPIMAPMITEGLSLRVMAARLTAASIQTPNGGLWTADAVRRLKARL